MIIIVFTIAVSLMFVTYNCLLRSLYVCSTGHRKKHASLFCHRVSDDQEKKFSNLATRVLAARGTDSNAELPRIASATSHLVEVSQVIIILAGGSLLGQGSLLENITDS